MIKLSVSIGASLQVKNARGEWDWIKPEVGAEISIDPEAMASQLLLAQEELVDENTFLQLVFGNLWDNVVGPQFKNVVTELVAEPVKEKVEETVEEEKTEESVVSDEDEYY